MKTEFRSKFLQHLSQKKEDEGFTLIELLVVIIIIGILSAIALPSFLNQANKAKQSEAKQYTGSMNRQQQAYFLEKDFFTTTLVQLGLGIKSQTENYVYGISGPSQGNGIEIDLSAADGKAEGTGVNNYGFARSDTLRSYQGAVQTGEAGSDVATELESTTLAVLCESNTAGIEAGDLDVAQWSTSTGTEATGPFCPESWTSL